MVDGFGDGHVCGGMQHCFDICQAEKDHGDECYAGDATDEDGVDHGAGSVQAWGGHLFGHVAGGVETDEGEGALDETEDPGYAITAPGFVGEVGEDGGGVAFGGGGQDDDAGYDDCKDGSVYWGC